MTRLDELLLDFTWDQEESDPTRKIYWALYRWLKEATAEIDRLQAELETERKQRKEADATLDAMLWNATS